MLKAFGISKYFECVCVYLGARCEETKSFGSQAQSRYKSWAVGIHAEFQPRSGTEGSLPPTPIQLQSPTNFFLSLSLVFYFSLFHGGMATPNPHFVYLI